MVTLEHLLLLAQLGTSQHSLFSLMDVTYSTERVIPSCLEITLAFSFGYGNSLCVQVHKHA